MVSSKLYYQIMFNVTLDLNFLTNKMNNNNVFTDQKLVCWNWCTIRRIDPFTKFLKNFSTLRHKLFADHFLSIEEENHHVFDQILCCPIPTSEAKPLLEIGVIHHTNKICFKTLQIQCF